MTAYTEEELKAIADETLRLVRDLRITQDEATRRLHHVIEMAVRL